MNSENELVGFIKNELEKRNWTYADLSRNSGISQAQISRIINNGFQPGLNFLTSITKAFNIPSEIIFIKAGIINQNISNDLIIKEIECLLGELNFEERLFILEFVKLVIKRKEKLLS